MLKTFKNTDFPHIFLALAPFLLIALLLPIYANAYTENIFDRITRFANHFEVPPKLLIHMAYAESGVNPDAIGDMEIICKRTGKPVRSRGMFQISECYHPEVSDSQAKDIDFALIFTAQMIQKGRCFEWTTCRKWYRIKSNGIL